VLGETIAPHVGEAEARAMAGDDVVNYATKLHGALECEGEGDSRVEVATARVAAGSLTVTKAQLGTALLTARLREVLHSSMHDLIVFLELLMCSGEFHGTYSRGGQRPQRTQTWDREVIVPAILAAAEIEFATRGFTAARTESIAARK
jgi:hypothetical protein